MNKIAQMHKFTPHARQAIAFAQQEAERLEHHYIGTEHLLLGLLDEKDSKAAHLLARFQIDEDTARQHIQAMLRTLPRSRQIAIALGPLGTFTLSYRKGTKRTIGSVPFTERVRKCIQFAVEETERLHAGQIDTVHLLLGIVREGKGIGSVALENLGVDMEALKKMAENA